MNKNYTIISLLLVFAWSFLVGAGVTVSSAQSGCGINVTSFNVLPSEVTVDGVLYKRVQVVVNNPNPGFFKRFYFLIDDAGRDSTTKLFQYGFNTDEFLVPVAAQVITFFDANLNTCMVEYDPNLAPNICTFNVDTDIDLSEDCFNRTVTFSVHDSVQIDSVAWIRNGGSVPVNDQMSWTNIPPGSYEIFFYDVRGCETTTSLSTCTTKTEAGDDHTLQYCIGVDDTVNLYDILDGDVDSGGFYTESFTPLDSLSGTQLSFLNEGQMKYYYIAPAKLEIPDTSLITIHVRDCSVCEYELISARRFCSSPETVEMVIGGGSMPGADSTFLVTLPDGSTTTRIFFEPFQFDFPDLTDSIRLHLHTDTPTGVCDSSIMVPPLPNPMIVITASEVELQGDSVGIRVAAGQGVEPYQIDIFVGAQQKFVQLQEGLPAQLDFLQSQDTAYIMVMDDQGCVGMDTVVLTQNCISPGVVSIPATCGANNGQIALDSSSLPAGSQITWQDIPNSNLWNRTDLSPDTFFYTVIYDDCMIEDQVIIENTPRIDVEVATSNECLLDGKVEIFMTDSAQVSSWSYGDNELSAFSGHFPANEDHQFYYETIDGCLDSVVIRVDEPYWLDKVGYQEPKGLTTTLGIDLNELSDFGWTMGDSILCHPCGDYESEMMLTSGAYTFFAEQGPGCRNDTTITINQSEHQFLMPNVITPGQIRNNYIQIFDPLDQMESIMEFQVYDRFGNILYKKSNFFPDDDSSLDWPNGMATELPDIIVCITKIKCKEGDEVTMAQDVLILR